MALNLSLLAFRPIVVQQDNSMYPNIEKGQHIKKITYYRSLYLPFAYLLTLFWTRSLDKGDIIAFQYHNKKKKTIQTVTGRIVSLEGELVATVAKNLVVNNRRIPIYKYEPTAPEAILVPFPYNYYQFEYYKEDGINRKYLIQIDNQIQFMINRGPVLTPPDSLGVVGDNRDHTPYFFGPESINKENVIGIIDLEKQK